ncbi:hypothetical protein D3C86_1870770 [compost metagenome]
MKYIYPGDGFEATEKGKQSGKGHQYRNRLPHRDAQDLPYQEAPGKKPQRQPGDQDLDERIPGQDVLRRTAIPFTHKFGHGTHFGSQVFGCKNNSQQE